MSSVLDYSGVVGLCTWCKDEERRAPHLSLMQVHVHVCLHLHACVHACSHMYVHVCVCLHVRLCMRARVWVCVCACACVALRTCVSVHSGSHGSTTAHTYNITRAYIIYYSGTMAHILSYFIKNLGPKGESPTRSQDYHFVQHKSIAT